MLTRDEATIMHADLDAFFASVEQRDDPSLRDRAIAVGGGGVILAASYEAKAFGVRTAMGGRQAKQMCPNLQIVPPRFSAYTAASRAVFDVFDNTTPIVEPMSIDEAFLDVGGLRKIAGTPTEIATKLRRDVLEQVGLRITIGIARTKFLAKVASAVGKPDGLLVVPAGTELEFLHPLRVERLWGVGKVTATKLNDKGIFTVGQIAGLTPETLVSMLGRASGSHLYALANNHDPRPVQGGRRRRSIGSQRALGRTRRTADELDTIVVGLVDRVTRRMRDAHRAGRTVTLRLRFDDFTRATRSHTMPRATAHTETILAAVRSVLATAMPLIGQQGLTLIGLSVGNLDDDESIQLALPFDGHGDGRLDSALDAVREKFGSNAVTRTVMLGRDQGIVMPMLPD